MTTLILTKSEIEAVLQLLHNLQTGAPLTSADQGLVSLFHHLSSKSVGSSGGGVSMTNRPRCMA